MKVRQRHSDLVKIKLELTIFHSNFQNAVRRMFVLADIIRERVRRLCVGHAAEAFFRSRFGARFRRSWRISSIRDALDCPDLARLNVICMGLLPDCTASEPSPSALSRTNAGTFVEPEHAPDGGARLVRVGRRDPDGSTYGRAVQETFFAAPDVNGAPRTLHPMRLSPSVRS